MSYTYTPKCVRDTGGFPGDPCWCGVCDEDLHDDEDRYVDGEETREKDIARIEIEDRKTRLH